MEVVIVAAAAAGATWVVLLGGALGRPRRLAGLPRAVRYPLAHGLLLLAGAAAAPAAQPWSDGLYPPYIFAPANTSSCRR